MAVTNERKIIILGTMKGKIKELGITTSGTKKVK
jgi:hypothetical protein